MPRLPRLELRTAPSTIYEDAVLNEGSMLSQAFAEEEDDDADYEVYLFWPSTSSYFLLPEDNYEDDLYEATSPTLYSQLSESNDGLCAASTQPPMSPTFTFASDYVFPERDTRSEMDLAGYSRLFTAGLGSKSRQITRQLDNAYHSLRRFFKWTSWFGRRAA